MVIYKKYQLSTIFENDIIKIVRLLNISYKIIMKKIIEKVKKTIILAILTITSFPKKIFADTIKLLEEEKNRITPLYGVTDSTTELIIWRLAK